MSKCLCIWLFLLSGSWVFGQAPTLFNQTHLYISSGAEIHVNGNMVTSGSTSLSEHYGLIQTYTNPNDGHFELQNEGVVESKGNYRIHKDWINNGAFLMDSGTVELYGDNQWFRGDSISGFVHLLLTGTDRKEQEQDIRVKLLLDITSRELAVHDQQLYIDNAADTAIRFDASFQQEGIISTDEDGVVHKVANSNEWNTVPVGSSEGSFRHRPIRFLLTQNSATDTALITFHHHSPDQILAWETDLDTSLCKIQNRYFYTFRSAQPNNLYDLELSYLTAQDGYYPHGAQWFNPTWKALYTDLNIPGSTYDFVRLLGETDFVNEHYTLSYRTPAAPVVPYDSTECYSLVSYQIEQPLGQPWYQWDVSNTTHTAEVINGQGTIGATIDWNGNMDGSILVSYTDSTGCWSHADTLTITDVSVDASFTYAHNNNTDLDNQYQIFNHSSSNADEIQWSIDGNAELWWSGYQLNDVLEHTFPGDGNEETHEIMLIAVDHEHGCIDTMVQVIHIPAGFAFYVPNTFSPNGDEFNQTFHARAEGVSQVRLQIFNRWGELIHSSGGTNLEEVYWDGTYLGRIAPTGTYVYQFEVVPQDYNGGIPLIFSGHVNVLP